MSSWKVPIRPPITTATTLNPPAIHAVFVVSIASDLQELGLSGIL
jgi:hypothetical protein